MDPDAFRYSGGRKILASTAKAQIRPNGEGRCVDTVISGPAELVDAFETTKLDMYLSRADADSVGGACEDEEDSGLLSDSSSGRIPIW
jgi:hypothetical protein